MSNDIDAIVRGFKKNKISSQIKSSQAKLHSLVEKLTKVEKSLASTSKNAKRLNENLHKGHKFMDAYEEIFSNMPTELVSLDHSDQNSGESWTQKRTKEQV